jgi:bifunctional UDP-N-acetylglucosamine pyrophosphorylase/glucosamine-1-phosphate N-acetyltransferase
VPTENPSDYGILRFKGDKVAEIVENPKEGAEPSKTKISGTYLLDAGFFECYESLPKHHPEDFVDALNAYLKKREVLFAIMKDALPSLKYPWDLLKISRFMFSGKLKNYIAPSATIGRNVSIPGDVYIGENVVIGDNTIISEDCYIGDNCKIGSNNVLRGPVVLEKDVLTGSFMEIKDSIIREGTHFHSGYIGDSVVGQNCRFGAGFITANRRIDRGNVKSTVKGSKVDTELTYFGCIVGDNSKFGIHSGTMPGVLIGSDCLVGPGTLVFENLGDRTAFYSEFKNHKEVRK